MKEIFLPKVEKYFIVFHNIITLLLTKGKKLSLTFNFQFSTLNYKSLAFERSEKGFIYS